MKKATWKLLGRPNDLAVRVLGFIILRVDADMSRFPLLLRLAEYLHAWAYDEEYEWYTHSVLQIFTHIHL